MVNAHRIQIALQGGGAKLSALLAAMDAVTQCENNKEIKVTRLAGTSAGSIAACLFAAGTGPGDIKLYFERHKNDFTEGYSLPTLTRAFYQLCIGRPSPLWSERPLREMLRHFLNEEGFVTFEDFKAKRGVEVQVYSTDLVNQTATIHAGTENIIEGVLHSCGLPYLFRVPGKHGTPPVDGGICENLPIENLRAAQHVYGPVVAISFKKSRPKIPEGILGFSLALIDTAISNSVERSKTLIPGPFVHEIETITTTFDFETALNSEKGGLGDDYKDVYDSTTQYLSKLTRHLNESLCFAPPHWETVDPTAVHVMEESYRAYKLLEESQPKKRLRTSFKVTANCLLEAGDPRRLLDIAQHTTEFLVSKTPISCLACGIHAPPGTPYRGIGDWYIEQGGIRIRHRKNIVVVPVRDPQKPKRRRFVFYFDSLPVHNLPYKFVFQDYGDEFMKPLKEGGRDVVGYSCSRQDGEIDVVDLILHVPEKFRGLAMYGGNFGSRITEEDLMQDDRSPAGFIAYAWRALKVPANQRVHFEIV